VSRSNIRDWRVRQIIYFQPNFADPGQDHDAMAGLHPAIIVAVIGAVMVANPPNRGRNCQAWNQLVHFLHQLQEPAEEA